MNKADLHLHTTASDGLLSPEEIVTTAYNKGLKAIAITDHDTVKGIKNAINKSKDINILVIPGIEFSCELKNFEIHVLGLFVDVNCPNLIKVCDELELSRKNRIELIIKKLNSLNINIDYEKLSKNCKEGTLGRPHVARALVAKKYVDSVQEAFDRYLSYGKEAYVSRFKLLIEDAISIIHKSGGIAILAHPALIKDYKVETLLNEYNFDGIEVYHSKHTDEDIKEFKNLANKYNLIITGGSDFHGEPDNIQVGDNYIFLEEITKWNFKNSEILRRFL